MSNYDHEEENLDWGRDRHAYDKSLRRAGLLELENALAPPIILLAEDNPDMRHVVAHALQADGYDVREVKDGRELLDRLSGNVATRGYSEPDLIISDIRMPGWSGLEVLGGLRDCDWAMPVILITAFGDDETHAEAKRLGAATVLDKPFDIDDLLAAVHDLVPAPAGYAASLPVVNG